MARIVKQRSKKAGLPPGSLVHIGEKRGDKAKVAILDYDEAHVQEKEVETIEECFIFKDHPTVTWIDVDRIDHVETIEKLGGCYGLHPLVLEDILNTDQRPKMEEYDSYSFIVLNMLYYRDQSGQVDTEQVSLILGKNFVLSFQEGKEGDVFGPLRDRIRTGKGRIRKMGADYLAYAMIDAIVDHYFIILEKLGERIESLEDALVAQPTTGTLKEIHSLKREMILLRKAVWPLREVIGSLTRGESPLIQESTRVYLRDVYDHTIQVIDSIETFRDMVSGMLDIYLSSVSNRLNAVMKVLTIIATVFMPLTFLAGVYGMNFKHMPELEWTWAYPALWLVMIAIGVVMLVYFRKKKWL
jgi:magnesium transporter